MTLARINYDYHRHESIGTFICPGYGCVRVSVAGEICCDCSGTGWLHMNNGGADDHLIGHVCGKFIDRCDGCGHHRFADGVEAERAHREECGCGHGLPNNSRDHIWVDYGGGDGQIARAMLNAGFDTIITDSSDSEDFRTIEVVIPKADAALFIETLDTAYDSLPGKEGAEMKDEKVLDENTKNGYRRLAKTPSFEGGPCGGPLRAATLDELNKAVPSSRGVPSLLDAINSPLVRVSAFGLEEITRAGCRPVLRLNGELLTTFDGKPIVILERAAPLADDRKRKAQEDVVDAAYLLIAQLNEMNFQDHPKTEQLRLESRRRGLVDALGKLQHALNSSLINDKTSHGRDRVASIIKEQFPTAGGYRIEELSKLEDENVLMGKIYLDGQYHHVQFVEVQTIDGEQQPVNDPERRYYDGVGQFNDECMRTVKLAGFTGNYVMFIFPAAP